ncbi:hypothetical protein Trydic_g6815 [Trypoxylus dichotomus]
MQNSYMNTTKPTYSPINYESRTGLFNGATSTPLSSPVSHLKNSLFLRNKLTPVKSPPQYNLSEVSNSNTRSPKLVQNASGPLLASTRFNVSLGTYSDTKSPGLTNRIVQYSNEAKQKQTPTHQTKYGSLGLFPVVHFFKKDIPTTSPQPRKVTVKIASPDTSWYNSPEFGMKKLNVRSANAQNGSNAAQITTEAETRSVLDALKEISRKRIHTTPDLEMEQDVCKRQKRSDKVVTASDNNKRAREEDSPVTDPQNKGAIQQTAKKVCVVDMLAASYTSSQLYKEQLKKGLKRKIEFVKAEKIAAIRKKSLNVGTQTKESRLLETDNMEYEQNHPKPLLRTMQLRKAQPKKSIPLEPCRNELIFDEGRLEINRKNRLTKYLSALTGEKPVYFKYEKPTLSETEGEAVATPSASTSPPKLISILSPLNKPKHDKHVTFNLPAERNGSGTVATSTSASVDMADQISTATSVSTPTKDNTNSSIAVSNPETPRSILTAPTVTKLNFGEANSSSTTKEMTRSVNPITTTAAEPVTEEVKPSQFAFTSPATQTTSAATSMASPFTFGAQTVATSNVSSLVTSVSSEAPGTLVNSTASPKTGGFKFDLTKSPSEANMTPSSKSSTTALSQNTHGFSFGTTTQGTENKPLPETSKPQATVISSSAFEFGANKLTSNPSTGKLAAITSTTTATMFNTPAVTSVANNTSQTTPTFQQPTTLNSNALGSASFNLTRSTVAPTTNALGMPLSSAFGAQPIGVNTSTTNSQPNTQVNTAGPFVSAPGFGTTTTTSNVPAFGIVVTSSNTPAFGTAAPSSNPSAFGAPMTTSNATMFGTAVTSPNIPAFGTMVTSSSAPAFGVGVTSSNTPAFGTSTSSNAPAFGTTTSSNAPGFGSAVTNANAPPFGPGTNPAFGFLPTPATSAFSFGATNTISPSTIPAFGAATTTSSMFGTPTTSASFVLTSSGFGTNTTGTPAFGTPVSTITTTSSGFPTNPTGPIFNATTTSSGIFETKNENKPFAFGPGQNNLGGGNTSFNAPTSKPAFNFSAPTTSSTTGFSNKPAAPAFGPGFPSSNIFVNPSNNQSSSTTTAASNIFKSPSTTSFGTASNQFGSKPENTFGAKAENVFGGKTENNFGAFNNSFGTSGNPSGFGNNNNTNAFGSNTGATFGSNTNTSGFGAAPTNTSGFGANSTGFGTSSNNPNGFGGTNTNNTSGFGMNTSNNNAFPITPVSSSGFGAASNATNTFGANSNTPGFGSGANNNNNATFGSGNVFGNTNPNPPAFGFNAGDSTSAFAKSPPSAGVFGNPPAADSSFQFNTGSNNQGGFGNATNAAPGGQTGVFAFGSSNQPPAPSGGVFTFGSNENKPAFNFNAGSNQMPGFGGGAPNFNAGSAPAFNPPSQFGGVAGVFSIGSSGSTPAARSRAQLKPKRRM